MDYADKLCEKGVLHITVCALCFYYFGFVYGILAIWAIIRVSDILLSKVGYQRLTGVDYAHTFECDTKSPNMVGYFVYEKMKFEEFRDTFYEKAVKKMRKLSTIQVKHFGMVFWKDIDTEIAKRQIFKIDANFKNENDIIKYCNEIGDQDMPKDKPLWEMRFCENYGNNE